MKNLRSGLGAAMALAAVASMSGSANIFTGRAFDMPTFARHSGYRQGRRFNGGRKNAKAGNPAGTKLARKAARGTLTICAIR